MDYNKRDFCILAAYHKKSKIIENSCIVPIQVGRTLSPYIIDNMIGDDTGDNISDKNYNYAELTAIYWAWKNIESKYKGLMHYRRFLDLNENGEYKDKDYYEVAIDDNFDSAEFLNELKINEDRIKEILENNLIITRKKEDLRTWSNYTVMEHYKAVHIGEHLDAALNIIKKDFPQYYDCAVNLMEGYCSYFGNMVIMKSKDFDDYANFLFSITSKVDNQINLYDYRLQQYSSEARYNGFLGERLTAIYINQKIREGFNIAEFPAAVLTVDKNKKWNEYNTCDTTSYYIKNINKEKYDKKYIKNNEDETMPKVSVAIACYNVEKYIEKCIETVINQTLENIEIIVINDGSTDKTKCIIEKYASADNRIKIVNKDNGGLGSVRNLSLQEAKGEYIFFMDGDDYMDSDFLECMVKNADKNGSEMAFCLHRVVDENNNFLYNSTAPYTLYGHNLNIFNLPDLMLLPVHVWDKIFRTKFLRDSKIYFPNRGTGEDIVFFYKVLFKLNDISVLRDVKYNYRFNQNSTQSKRETVLNGLNNILISQNYIDSLNNPLILEYWQLFIYVITHHIIFRAKNLFIKDKNFPKEFYILSAKLFERKIKLSKNIEKIKAYYNWVDFDLIEKMYSQNNYNKWTKYLNNFIAEACFNFMDNIFSIKSDRKYKIIRILGIKITIKK